MKAFRAKKHNSRFRTYVYITFLKASASAFCKPIGLCVWHRNIWNEKKMGWRKRRKLFEMKNLNATLCVSCDTDLQTNTYGCRCEFVSQAYKLCRKDSLNIKISFIFDVVSGQNCNIDSKWKIYRHTQ